jgi:hypothetical protein
MYYKIVKENGVFMHTLAKSYKPEDIPTGEVFVAQKFKSIIDVQIKADEPMIHFTDSACETLLWYDVLSFHGSKSVYIYEITPITEVTKQRCITPSIYQSGANKIEFGRRIDKKTLFKLAKEELMTNKETIYTTYPDIDWNSISKRWDQGLTWWYW